MEQYNSFVLVRFQIIVLLASLSLWGCGPLHITPTEIQVDSPKDRLLEGVSIALKNAETDSAEYNMIFMQNRNDTSVRTNKRQCIDMIVKGLNKGLDDRGARITEESSFVVSMAMQEIAYENIVGVWKCYSTVNVAVGSTWKRKYQGQGAASSWGVGPVKTFTSALNRSFSDVVTLILTGEEFLSVLKAGERQ
ncbi:MAG TPA: hypothetical protein VL122_02600 [Nitrospirota bacterium]|nr:hypothetical protein [Nitrospirota bacterium]